MLVRDAAGIWRSPLLSAEPWLEHGFGGRHAVKWPPEHAAAARQVHGDTVLRAGEAGPCGEGDALLTSTSGLWVGIRTADCVPLLFADRRQHLVAAVHAGWRGTAARIAIKTLQAMGSAPEELRVAIGPSIGACCYEVGPEVSAKFGRTGKIHLDLVAENRKQLLGAGVPMSQIDAEPLCTRCGGDFHSFRRDGERAGRMVSAIRIANQITK
jgi:polyphenol oxidase